MGPAAEAQDEASRADRIRFWRERRAGNGNAESALGEQTRAQPLAPLEGRYAKQIAGVEPWPDCGMVVADTEGGDDGVAFSGLTAEWTASVAARL